MQTIFRTLTAALLAGILSPVAVAATINLDPDKDGQATHRIGDVLLRARNQCTAIVNEADHRTTVEVIHGSCTVRNELDRSVVQLRPGTIYETTTKHCDQFLTSGYKRMALFETEKGTTNLLVQDGARTKATIICPPSIMNYAIGSLVLSDLHLPPNLVQHFPPSGVIEEKRAALAESGREIAK